MTCAPMIAPGMACITWGLPLSLRLVCHRSSDGNSLRTAIRGERGGGEGSSNVTYKRRGQTRPLGFDPTPFMVHFGAVVAEKLGEKRVAWRLEGIVEGAGGGDGPGHCVVVVLRTPFLRSPAPRIDADRQIFWRDLSSVRLPGNRARSGRRRT